MDRVKLGIDNLDSCINIFKNKKVGLITNPTGVNSEFASSIDILRNKTKLNALYSPEHGIRGDAQAGDKIENGIDKKTGIMAYSLYGKNKKPSYEVLKDIDIVAFDIQDAGSRFYTYIYSMSNAMESCKEYGLTFVVFDRPNPIGGAQVEGNILDINYKSFIGMFPITQRYGLTIGELAVFFNEKFNIHCNLKIVPMSNWNREMYYDETGLSWIMPSPNLPTIDTALVYNGTCVFEGTNISEGRGTTKPFEIIGAPWLDAYRLADRMNELKLPGVFFRPTYFTPTFSKHAGKLCSGIQMHVTDRKKFMPVASGISLLYTIREESGDKFEFLPAFTEKGKPIIDYNTGGSDIRNNKYSLKELLDNWRSEAEEFKKNKEEFHLYK